MSVISTVGGVFEEAGARLNETYTDEENQYSNWFNLCTNDIAISFPNAPFNYVSADRTLSASNRLYTNLPSDFDKMMNITYPGGDVKLAYLSEEEFNALQPSATEAGTPMLYTLHGATNPANTQVEFYPVPATGITVNYEYRKLPTSVSCQSAQLVSIIPPKYTELYVLFIQKEGLKRREDYTQSSSVESKYEAMKQAMMNDFNRMTEEPLRIKSIKEFTPANRTYGDEIVNMFWGDN